MFKQDQEIFNILLNSVSEGVVVVDEKQNIIEINKAGELMFGYNENELSNQPLNILIPKNHHAKHDNHFKGFVKENKQRRMGHGRDIFGAKKDGTVFPIEASLNPFTIYGQNFIMALVIDITERKNYTEKLEKTVAIRTDELNKALTVEKELNELKTKFLSMVSHEFKTPLSGILTSTILLNKYNLTEQQDKREKHIQTITDKVQYLNTILTDFLSVEKLEKGKVNYKFSTFKLSKVLNEVIYNANMLLKAGQQINYPINIDDLSLHQDEKIVELALSNLIYNAIKYSNENTIIAVEISQNDNTTIFKITDNGIGIPEKDQKNIFNRYFRAENALLMQGTGIGLNIAKDHLENLNGSLTFISKEHEGSTFIIELPNKAHL
jgi:PAS domain S-box-containing protein